MHRIHFHADMIPSTHNPSESTPVPSARHQAHSPHLPYLPRSYVNGECGLNNVLSHILEKWVTNLKFHGDVSGQLISKYNFSGQEESRNMPEPAVTALSGGITAA